MTTLIAATSTEQDGVNLFPLIVAVVLLAGAAVFAYLRRRRG